MSLTPFQTVGPYFEVLLRSRQPCRQVTDQTSGERVVIEGVLYDGEGRPIPDGLIETWQADASGRYRHPDEAQESAADAAFSGFGWCHTDEDGRFRSDTIKPGAVAGPDGRMQAPHILMSVMARGILIRYITRLYFGDADAANAGDPILALVPASRRSTLIAEHRGGGTYRFNIRLQGRDETVFFDA